MFVCLFVSLFASCLLCALCKIFVGVSLSDADKFSFCLFVCLFASCLHCALCKIFVGVSLSDADKENGHWPMRRVAVGAKQRGGFTLLCFTLFYFSLLYLTCSWSQAKGRFYPNLCKASSAQETHHLII